MSPGTCEVHAGCAPRAPCERPRSAGRRWPLLTVVHALETLSHSTAAVPRPPMGPRWERTNRVVERRGFWSPHRSCARVGGPTGCKCESPLRLKHTAPGAPRMRQTPPAIALPVTEDRPRFVLVLRSSPGLLAIKLAPCLGLRSRKGPRCKLLRDPGPESSSPRPLHPPPHQATNRRQSLTASIVQGGPVTRPLAQGGPVSRPPGLCAPLTPPLGGGAAAPPLTPPLGQGAAAAPLPPPLGQRRGSPRVGGLPSMAERGQRLKPLKPLKRGWRQWGDIG